MFKNVKSVPIIIKIKIIVAEIGFLGSKIYLIP